MPDTGSIPRFIATVKNVSEIMLVGAADYDVWARRLEREERIPYRRADGRAEVMVLACGSRFRGISFRECSVSMWVSDGDGSTQDGAFMLHAFNSQRCFAWSERRIFGTPYDHATVALDTQAAASLSAGDAPILEAQMGQPQPPVEAIHREQTFRIDFPRRANKPAKLFYASVSGPIRTIPFDETRDRFAVHPPTSDHPLQTFADSDFQPEAWHIGDAGVHARTKTVHRPAG